MLRLTKAYHRYILPGVDRTGYDDSLDTRNSRYSTYLLDDVVEV